MDFRLHGHKRRGVRRSERRDLSVTADSSEDWCRRALAELCGPFAHALAAEREPTLVLASHAGRLVGHAEQIPQHDPVGRVLAPPPEGEADDVAVEHVLGRFRTLVAEIPIPLARMDEWGMPTEAVVLSRWTGEGRGTTLLASTDTTSVAELLDCRGLGPGAVIGFAEDTTTVEAAMDQSDTPDLEAWAVVPAFDDEGLVIVHLPRHASTERFRSG